MNYSNLEQIRLNATAEDSVTVWSTAATTPVAINGAGTVTVQDTNYTLDQIRSDLAVSNVHTLTLDASGARDRKVVTIDSGSISGLSPLPVRYSNIGTFPGTPGLVVNTGSGNDSIDAETPAAGMGLKLSTGPGTNSVIVRNASGAVNVVGSGSDDLLLDDLADGNAGTVYLHTGRIIGLFSDPTTYSGVRNLNVQGGSGGNTYDITEVPSGLALSVRGGGGADTVVIGKNGSLAYIMGTVNVSNSGCGTTKLTIDDSQDPYGQYYQVTSSSVYTHGTYITYGFGVNSLEIDLGKGQDYVDVQSVSSSAPVTVWADALDTRAGPAASQVTWNVPYVWLYPSSTATATLLGF